ncbi:hypothetical protein EJB05_56072, partial [Eragrostis curvula]
MKCNSSRHRHKNGETTSFLSCYFYLAPATPLLLIWVNPLSQLTTALLLCLLGHGTDVASGWDDRDFFSKDGPEIRFPLRLGSGNKSSLCGSTTCTKLACSGRDTILLHPFLGPSKVTAIDYKLALMNIIPLAARSSVCPINNLSLPVRVDDNCGLYANNPGRLVGCSREFMPHGVTPRPNLCDNCNDWARTDVPAADLIAGPIPCLGNSSRFMYLVHAYLSMSLLQQDCKAVSNRSIPIFFTERPAIFTYTDTSTFKQRAEATISSSEITVSWRSRWEDGYTPNYNCSVCEQRGRRCAFSSQRNQTFCMPNLNGSRIKVIAATSTVACFIVLSLAVLTALYFSLKSKYNEEIHLKVEMFLQTYRTSKPTRYSFSEVKKIARRFKQRDIVLDREIAEEKETVRRLAIVALWCIQWNPQNRPSMTKVVNMLTGRSQNLQIPPMPYA